MIVRMSEQYDISGVPKLPPVVHPRETVLFFRSYAHYAPAGDCWHLEIHGRVYAPSRRIFRNSALLSLLKQVVKPDSDAEARRRFFDRAKLFLMGNRKGKSVPIAIGELGFTLPNSTGNGRFQTTLTLPQDALASVVQADSNGRRFIQFCAHLPEKDSRKFGGQVELIPTTGVSVISDIDDTIKVTNVQDRKELLANTFTREFRSVPQMSGLYQRWAARGMSFHYVSASPWPLYEPILDWLNLDGFPAGSLHLRDLKLRELGKDRRKQASFLAKRLVIEQILRAFPQRRFVLCGDSGEHDASLYGTIARSFGAQITDICIRQLEGAPTPTEAAEVTSTRRHTRWHFFQDPLELEEIMQPVSAMG